MSGSGPSRLRTLLGSCRNGRSSRYGLEIPPHAASADEQEEDAPVLWPGDKAMAEALRAAQGDEVVSNWFSVKDFIAADGAMIRPFANYPHDWRAVQICSGLLLHQLRRSYSLTGTLKRRGLSDAEGDALVTRMTGEARSWFDRAASQCPLRRYVACGER